MVTDTTRLRWIAQDAWDAAAFWQAQGDLVSAEEAVLRAMEAEDKLLAAAGTLA